MEESFQLDEIDRKLLRLLQRDASQSHAALAQLVGASPAAVWRRIRAMETAGVLGNMVRLADPQQLGCAVTVMFQLRMKSHAPAARAAFEAFLLTKDEIVTCYSMSGEWDYWLRIVAGGVAEYERFLMRELLNNPAVAGAASHFALAEVKNTTSLPV